jgi:hypothetical protein
VVTRRFTYRIIQHHVEHHKPGRQSRLNCRPSRSLAPPPTPLLTARQQTTDASPPAELSAVVDDLLNSLSNKFAGVSSEIFAKSRCSDGVLARPAAHRWLIANSGRHVEAAGQSGGGDAEQCRSEQSREEPFEEWIGGIAGYEFCTWQFAKAFGACESLYQLDRWKLQAINFPKYHARSMRLQYPVRKMYSILQLLLAYGLCDELLQDVGLACELIELL